MDRKEAAHVARHKLKEYLMQTRGINLAKPFSCINPAHQDRHPSMRFYDNPNGQAVHCFACGAHYDIFDVVGIDENLPQGRALFDRTYQLLGINVSGHYESSPTSKEGKAPANTVPSEKENHVRYLRACREKYAQTDYWKRRGISEDTAARFGLGFDPEYNRSTGGRIWQAAILPTGEGSFVARNTDPAAESSARYRKTGPAQLFNSGVLEDDVAAVVVVEGEIDALSVEELGIPCIGLGSVANAGKLIQQVELMLSQHRVVPRLVIAMDADDAGRKAAETLQEGLQTAGAACVVADEFVFCGCKDANEALVKHRKAFEQALNQAMAAAKHQATDEHANRVDAYMRKYGAEQVLEGFLGEIAENVNTRCIPTGFAKLDRALEGGFYEGLHVIGSVSSNGKTSFVLQIADQMAAMGQDILIFTLEMARSELIAKSVSRGTILVAQEMKLPTQYAKTVRGITDAGRWADYSDTELDLINRAIDRYASYAGHIFMVEGVGNLGVQDVRRITEEHILLTGRKPVVVIDYLQILAPYSDRYSDKQNTDRNVLELKRLSRDCKLPVIAISSFNRMGYHQEVSHEFFKESGAVEYSADTLIGMQLKGIGTPGFDAKTALQANPRNVQLVVLKNRNGCAGISINFDYYPIFNYFREG